MLIFQNSWWQNYIYDSLFDFRTFFNIEAQGESYYKSASTFFQTRQNGIGHFLPHFNWPHLYLQLNEILSVLYMHLHYEENRLKFQTAPQKFSKANFILNHYIFELKFFLQTSIFRHLLGDILWFHNKNIIRRLSFKTITHAQVTDLMSFQSAYNWHKFLVFDQRESSGLDLHLGPFAPESLSLPSGLFVLENSKLRFKYKTN